MPRSEASHPSLGNVIKVARTDRGWSREDLASKTDLSRNFVANMERGDNVSIDVLKRVAETLGLSELPLGPRVSLTITPNDTVAKRAVELSTRIAEHAVEIGRVLSEAAGDKAQRGDDKVLSFEPRRTMITLAEEQQVARLRSAIEAVGKKRSMVEYRVSYKAEPTRYVKPRRGRAAAGHGAVAEGEATPEEKLRQIPEHYYEERGARDTVVMVGDSLSDLGYVDHDLLFIRPLELKEPRDGDIVVCRIGSTEADTEVIVKVYAHEGRERWLLSANEREAKKYPPRVIGKSERFEVLGIVVGRSGYGLPGQLAARPKHHSKVASPTK